jgi:AbrB family looped-hinge helix DNA binding protein
MIPTPAPGARQGRRGSLERRKEPRFYGTVTVSERGQVAIPIEARRELEIQEGEKLLVFARGGRTLFLERPDDLRRRMGKMLSMYRSALDTDEAREQSGA